MVTTAMLKPWKKRERPSRNPYFFHMCIREWRRNHNTFLHIPVITCWKILEGFSEIKIFWNTLQIFLVHEKCTNNRCLLRPVTACWILCDRWVVLDQAGVIELYSRKLSTCLVERYIELNIFSCKDCVFKFCFIRKAATEVTNQDIVFWNFQDRAKQIRLTNKFCKNIVTRRIIDAKEPSTSARMELLSISIFSSNHNWASTDLLSSIFKLPQLAIWESASGKNLPRRFILSPYFNIVQPIENPWTWSAGHINRQVHLKSTKVLSDDISL